MNKREGISFNCEEDANRQTFYVVFVCRVNQATREEVRSAWLKAFTWVANILNVKRWPVAKVEWSKQYLLVIYHQSRAYHSIQHTVSKNKTQIHANMYFDTDKGSLVWAIYLCYVIMWDNSVGYWPHEICFLPHKMECVLITKRRHLAISFDIVHKTWWLCRVQHMKDVSTGKVNGCCNI